MTKEIWIGAKEASEIISKNSGRPVIQQYVRELAQKGRIASRPADGRTNEYLRSDVEKIKVRTNKKPSESAKSALVSNDLTQNTPVQGGRDEGHSEEDAQKEVDPAA